MTLSKAKQAPRESRKARHGSQTLSTFPKTKPATSGARKKATPTVLLPKHHFTKFCREHNWPPEYPFPDMPKSTAHLSANATRAAEAGVGHAALANALNLPGAVAFDRVVAKAAA